MATNDETIQLVIDAKNLASDEITEAALDLDKLADAAQLADKELDDLKFNQQQLASFEKMRAETLRLNAAWREQKTVTDELVASTGKLKAGMKEERAAILESKEALEQATREKKLQQKAYDALGKKVAEFGLHTRNSTEIQKKLNVEIAKATIVADKKTESVRKETTVLKAKVEQEKKAIAITKQKIAADEKAAYAENDKINASKKAATAAAAEVAATTKLEAKLKGYSTALTLLNKQKNSGRVTTANYIRSEEALRKQWKLNESQAKATRRAIESENQVKSNSGKSTDLLTSATRRLAQAYTVLLAAQKATAAVSSSVKGYSDLEAAITKVEKTTGIARDKVVEMADELRVLSEEITPTATNELLRYAEVAGQMGVSSTEDILKIVAAADALGVSTNLAGEEAATLSARILGMTGEGVSEIHEFSSALVELGNSTKTTEDEILHMTKEIVTGTTALGFGSAAAAGFGATLKEMGQPAERSRSAMQDLGRVIINMANDGGDSLQKLADITGLTADAIEDGLGKEPEQVVIRFIEGLKGAKDAGTTLQTSLAGVGITSKETNAVVGVLAENTERLSEVVDLSTAAYKDGTKHIQEASKRYADQEATLLRLANKFTTLKTKIGAAYAPKVMEAVDSFTAAIDDNEGAVISFMEWIPELVEGFVEVGEVADDLLSVFGGLDGAMSGLANIAKLTFNEITISIRGVGLALNETKIFFAELAGESEESLEKMRKKSAEISANITSDLQDMEDATNRFNGTSSIAYENFIDITDKYKDSISRLSVEQQAEIELLLQTNSLTGQAADYNAEMEGSYRKLATVLTRASSAQKIENKLVAEAKRPAKEAAAAAIERAEAISTTGLAIANLVKQQKNIDAQREKSVLTERQAIEINANITKGIEKQQAKLLELTLGKKKAAAVNQEALNLSKSYIEIEGKKVSITDLAAASNLKHADSAIGVKDSLTLLNGEVLTGAKLTEYLAESTKGMVVSSDFFTGAVEDSSEAVRDLNIQENNLTSSIKDLKKQLTEANIEIPKRALLTLQLKEAEEQLVETQKERALVEELEGKRASELRAIQSQTAKELENLNFQYKTGAITAKEYADQSEEIKLKLQVLDDTMGDVVKTTKELTAAKKEAAGAGRELSTSEDAVGNAQERRSSVQGVLAALMDIYTKAMERQNQVLDYSSDSTEDLTQKLVDLNEEYGELTKNTMPSSLVGLDRFLDRMTAINIESLRNEEATIRQTLALRKLTEQVQSGALNMEQLAGATFQANAGFNRLSDQQLAPLRAAIASASAEFKALADEIDSTFLSLQDRLDRLKGDEQSILSRQFKAEMTNLEELLTEAREAGDDALISKINKAISTLRNVNKIETKNLKDEQAETASNLDSSNKNNSNDLQSTKYEVTVKLPNGSTTTINTSSANDANALVSALSSLGEVNISGVS